MEKVLTENTSPCLLSSPLKNSTTPMPLTLPDRILSGLLRVEGGVVGGYIYMVESCGSIYLVTIGTRSYDCAYAAKVWELDLLERRSIEVKCLGDRAFFLCYDDCTWGWASTTTDRSESGRGVEGNCLYIFDDKITKGEVVMYNLKDCCSTLLPCGIRLNDNWSTKIVNWVMPQHHSFVAGQEAKKLTGNQDNDVSKSCRTIDTTECKQLLQQNELHEERLSKLPHDLMELLSRYMHLFDYWNFRSTSKLIRSGTPLPLWRTNNVFPLFLVFEDNGELCRLMDPCRDDSRPCVLRFSQDYFDIMFSKDGWLLISDCKTLEFFNPFTRERRDLPPNSSIDPIGFSTNPTCSKCLTVGFSNKLDEVIVIQYLRFGDTKWSSCHFDNSQDPQFCISYACSPVYYAGAFYWLDKSGYLGVFELVDEETSWRVYDGPFARARDFHSCYLVQCGPELLSVFIRRNGESVMVFSFKQSKQRWGHKLSLGNYALFLKSYSSTSVETNDTNMKNKIYLPLIQGHHIVYYCYETKKYYANGNEVSSNNFFFKKTPSRCCWI